MRCVVSARDPGSSATTNAAFGEPDVIKVAKAMPARYLANAQWVMAPQIGFDVRAFALSSGNVSCAFWSDLGGANPAQLLGKSVNYSTGMTSSLSPATASSDYVVAHADWSQAYTIVDRIGSFVQNVPVVLGSNRQPIGASGVVLWWRTGGKLVNTDAERLLVC